MEYLFATHNAGKLKEIRAVFAERGLTVRAPGDLGLSFTATETGATFADNAVEKARGCAALCKRDEVALADDSGLCVDALDGQPGVFSARWLGEDTPSAEKNRRLLAMLADTPEEKRTARFVCVIAAVFPDGRALTTEASLAGRIARRPVGENGFGFDPVFYLPERGKTFAQVSMEEKNRLSARGQALRAMLDTLAL